MKCKLDLNLNVPPTTAASTYAPTKFSSFFKIDNIRLWETVKKKEQNRSVIGTPM